MRGSQLLEKWELSSTDDLWPARGLEQLEFLHSFHQSLLAVILFGHYQLCNSGKINPNRQKIAW